MIQVIIFIGFFLRVTVSIWNGFFGPSFGADMDALSFHLKAVEYLNGLPFDEFIIGWIYSYILFIFYYLFSDSLFLGCLISCVAWYFSTIFLRKSLDLLMVDKKKRYMH